MGRLPVSEVPHGGGIADKSSSTRQGGMSSTPLETKLDAYLAPAATSTKSGKRPKEKGTAPEERKLCSFLIQANSRQTRVAPMTVDNPSEPSLTSHQFVQFLCQNWLVLKQWRCPRRPLLIPILSFVGQPWYPNVEKREDDVQAKLPRSQRTRILDLTIWRCLSEQEKEGK